MEVLPAFLKIGEVAQESGLPVKTIRYYEEIGLLAPSVERSATGYRLFQPHVLSRLAFIKRAQNLGLSLAEIKQILAVYDQGDLPCGEVKQHLQEKVSDVTRQIEELTILRSELLALLSGWREQFPEGLSKSTVCPNIQR
ncbi:MAG TPA: heavy metal-responsive transcriptional regulator [Leptolyngbyaceae cyanobacterium M33_DOE_097]|uniref:Heavy metal-responsive transcriptional regulator n=1 Tax=Oscillatoriales cyanobacterium SpSt-418 TaxID=2282169 RepID=A0A7C3KF66_9CYAN|nr:heavy metal-responsive transcriptional regulator [Leptolyngbyaceae cyanobacterium M33_DOE_097]